MAKLSDGQSFKLSSTDLKDFLDAKVDEYQRPEFLATDPIQIPHSFERKEDIEISGFLSATIAWGNRKSIIQNANSMMERMDNSPFDFVLNANLKELKSLDGFIHRTFNSSDLVFFVRALKTIYKNHGGLEAIFTPGIPEENLNNCISKARQLFLQEPHEMRSEKHFSDPSKGSAAKRIHMFLRWMVRSSETGIDFGIWNGIRPAQLSCPLDVHSGTVARKLGLLKRKQNDAKAVFELDSALRGMDPEDPVKYDFALFGLGVFERFGQ